MSDDNIMFTEHFSLYLVASKFTVVTDHRALTYLNKMNNRSIRLTRWSHTLQPYDCTFKFRRGKENQMADYLSRAPAEDHSSDDKRCVDEEETGQRPEMDGTCSRKSRTTRQTRTPAHQRRGICWASPSYIS